MTRETFKNTERAIAARIGGVRVPVTGRTRGSAPDIAHARYSIEVKHRKKLPELMHDAMRQAVASIRGQQLPIVIYHELGKRHDEDYVLVRLKDLEGFLLDLGYASDV